MVLFIFDGAFFFPPGWGSWKVSTNSCLLGWFTPLLPVQSPEDTPLETLAYVGGSRWYIETEFETEKGDVGLDEYETRSWAGWHHHIALCLLGGAFLLGLQQEWGKKMPRITRPQSLPLCKRGCTEWCARCCPGSGSGRRNCCYG